MALSVFILEFEVTRPMAAAASAAETAAPRKIAILSLAPMTRKATTIPGSAAWDITSPIRLWRRSTA